MTDDERIARGRRAGVEFRELDAAFQEVAARMTKDMIALPPGSPLLDGAHRQLHSLHEVRKKLLGYVQDGQIAETLQPEPPL